MARSFGSRRELPVQLPSGRHGLSRAYVVAHQRERILDAVASVASQVGYSAMSIDAITTASGVSRRTFYDLYGGKEEAFLATCDLIAARLADAVLGAYDPADPLPVRGRRCLEATIGFLCAHPSYAHVALVEVLAAGPAAIERRDRALLMLSGIVDQAACELPITGHVPSVTAEAVVGGVHAVLYRRLVQGRIDELAALVPDLLFSILLPFLGPDAAREAKLEAERAARRRS